MAKGNLFLGHAKGKVGSIVFARALGQQITRTKPSSVRNPKSVGQNTQRAILATIAKSAAAMTSLVDHSFAGVAYGAESVRHFRKINMSLLRNSYLSSRNAWMNITAKGGGFVPNYLKISEGNLPAFSVGVSAADGTVTFFENHDITMGEDATVGDFLDSYPYIQGGDQLTVVKIVKTAGSLQKGDGNFIMKLDRIVFAPNAFNDKSESFATSGQINTSLLDMTKTTNAECLVITTGTAGGGIGFSHDGEVYASACILSRKVNDKWQRSAQFLEQCNFDDYADNESAIASYGASASVTEDTEFLNQADDNDIISGVSGSYMFAYVDPDGGDSINKSVNAGSVDTINLTAAANTNFKLRGQGYGTGDSRVTQVEIYDNQNRLVAHGNERAWAYPSVKESTVGTWKIVTLFWDGRKATCNVVVAIKA